MLNDQTSAAGDRRADLKRKVCASLMRINLWAANPKVRNHISRKRREVCREFSAAWRGFPELVCKCWRSSPEDSELERGRDSNRCVKFRAERIRLSQRRLRRRPCRLARAEYLPVRTRLRRHDDGRAAERCSAEVRRGLRRRAIRRSRNHFQWSRLHFLRAV